jgi:hypothetical protein
MRREEKPSITHPHIRIASRNHSTPVTENRTPSSEDKRKAHAHIVDGYSSLAMCKLCLSKLQVSPAWKCLRAIAWFKTKKIGITISNGAEE